MSLVASLLLAGALSSSQTRLLDVSYTYTGMPLFMPSEEFRVSLEPVKMISQDTSVALRQADYTLESVTLFKNTTDGIVNGEVIIPLIYSGTYDKPVTVHATWNNQTIRHERVTQQIRGGTKVLLKYKVSVRPNAEVTFKYRAILPVGKMGYDQAERLISYHPVWLPYQIEHFNYVIRYEQGTIFTHSGNRYYFMRDGEVRSSSPWRVGETSAVRSVGAYQPNGHIVHFRYYPGGFGPVGGN